mmetsp:Transcript_37689/g.91542  ORF Transcript_37689/g.91542 Transcript_37689/m.91542 type:complete len:241 (-) Transcript_37689:324-1046(-)
MTCPVPSPLRTISFARPWHTSRRALLNSPRSKAAVTWFEAIETTVSLVDSSPSIERQLNVSLTIVDSISCKSFLEMVASVMIYESMVAMFGSIIPAPLAIPTILLPFDSVLLRTLGKRSVVMMASAAFKADLICMFFTAAGTISSASSFAGRRHPMTPVLEGNTCSRESKFSDFATASQTNSASCSPSPPEHTLDTLLLMTNAAMEPPSARRFLPTRTGAPGNLFDVKHAAQLSVGPSVS